VTFTSTSLTSVLSDARELGDSAKTKLERELEHDEELEGVPERELEVEEEELEDVTERELEDKEEELERWHRG